MRRAQLWVVPVGEARTPWIRENDECLLLLSSGEQMTEGIESRDEHAAHDRCKRQPDRVVLLNPALRRVMRQVAGK